MDPSLTALLVTRSSNIKPLHLGTGPLTRSATKKPISISSGSESGKKLCSASSESFVAIGSSSSIPKGGRTLEIKKKEL
ncbi:hypothetical protein A2U01_0079182, partial [Trifolium medium]|nr:hypothetical protein [Trifolium medium]